jgi:hypothetical protein
MLRILGRDPAARRIQSPYRCHAVSGLCELPLGWDAQLQSPVSEIGSDL